MPEQTIAVDLELTETYCRSFGVEQILAEIASDEPAIAAELREGGAPAVSAWLHRLQEDNPDHPVIQWIWGAMESDGEVSAESWTFSAPEGDRP